MTELDVIDTAVKVGLGAVISGLSTYFVTRVKSRDDLERERLKRHHELLEQTAEKIEIFSNAILRYWALITEFVRNRDKGIKMLDNRKEELQRSKDDLFKMYGELTSAESKVLLLGHKEAQRLLRAYGEIAKNIRRTAVESNNDLTEEKMNDFREELLDAREALFSELSKIYRKET